MINKSQNFTTSYSFLRNAEKEAGDDYYGNLSRRTLILIARLSRKGNVVYAEDLRSKMAINFKALAKILENLASSDLIAISIKESSSEKTEHDMSDIAVIITPEGEKISVEDPYHF